MIMNKRSWLSLCLSSLLLIACGGGQQGDESSAGVSSGGTGSYSNGSISAFGSIVVNGIHFDQRLATVTDAEGQAHTPDDLKLGMVVDLDASSISVNQGKQTASALAIRISSELLGPVDSVGADDLSLMGQIVRVDSQTYFGDTLPQRLQSVQVNDVLEVYGRHDPKSNTYIATRIEKRDPTGVAHFVVKGVVQNLNVFTGSCRIGNQYLSGWQQLPAGVQNGRVARATIDSQSTGVAGYWRTQAITLSTPLVTDRDDATVEGPVTAIPTGSTHRFSVNGIDVDARAANCPVCANLQLGDWVDVRGRLVNSAITAMDVRAAPR